MRRKFCRLQSLHHQCPGSEYRGNTFGLKYEKVEQGKNRDFFLIPRV